VQDAIGICAARSKEKDNERPSRKEVKREGKLIIIKEEGKMPKKDAK
jgi:hypothetical protein